MKLIHIVVVFIIYRVNCIVLIEEKCRNYNWNWIDFHYRSDINDFYRDRIKKILEIVILIVIIVVDLSIKKHQQHVRHGELQKDFVKMN